MRILSSIQPEEHYSLESDLSKTGRKVQGPFAYPDRATIGFFDLDDSSLGYSNIFVFSQVVLTRYIYNGLVEYEMA